MRVVFREGCSNRRLPIPKVKNSRKAERLPVVTHIKHPSEDVARNGVDLLNVRIQLGQGHPFVNDFELEPRGDGLSNDGGGADADGHTVIDLPSWV